MFFVSHFQILNIKKIFKYPPNKTLRSVTFPHLANDLRAVTDNKFYIKNHHQMAPTSIKGKVFLFSLFLMFHVSWVSIAFAEMIEMGSSSEPVVTESKLYNQESEHVGTLDLLERHQLQLEKLEELVKNLSLIVSRLESRLLEYPKGGTLESMYPKVEGKYPKGGILEGKEQSFEGSEVVLDEKVEKKKVEGYGVVGNAGSLESKVVEGERVRAVSVTKYSPFWLERFQFISAVKLGTIATSINVLPFRDSEGMSKYVVVGDDHGRVHAFSRNGEVLLDFQTSLDSPITAFMTYFSMFKNESVVITGHENGGILMHRIWEVMPDGDDRATLHMEIVRTVASPESGEGSSITSLEVHYVGRNRYILATDFGGKIIVFRENGTIQGLIVPKSKPLVFSKQRLLFLTETGAGSLDLRTMKIRESDCDGLNNTIAKSYVFDASERTKAYGVTSDGDLIQVLLLGDNANFKCRVRAKKTLEMTEPLAFQSIKGYLLIANQEKVSLYNVSSAVHYIRSVGPRLLFSATIDEVIASFLNYQSLELNDKNRKVIPLVGSDQDRLVILGMGSGYLGIYRSNLPVFKNEFHGISWTSPVLFFTLFVLAAYYFFYKKKEALTSWGPDDPFSSASVTSGAPLGSSQGDLSYADSSRNADLMDLRGSSLRGSGRYVSPSRYAGGAAGAYRSSSSDPTRPSSVDPNFRTTSDLKYRGSNLETPGFPKRRDSLFVNSQIVDDKK